MMAAMRWSLRIARIAGIDVKVHVTFFLLLAWVAWLYHGQGGWPAAVHGVVYVSLVFLCVVLHEFGHALAARTFGIRTPDITLLPIGGVARLERMPDKPGQEVIVALAGPLVNVVIAAALWLALLPGGGPENLSPLQARGGNLLAELLGVNLILVVFNMIPAFPMDGGRVLRALLALRLNYARATNIAATIGQGFAFVLGFIGLFSNPLLVFVAVFIYLGAAGEASFAQMRDVSSGLPVASAMVTEFKALTEESTLDEAIEAVLATSQHDFPVVGPGGEVRGVLSRGDLVAALRKSGAATPVAAVMRTDVPTLRATMPFDRAFAIMQGCDCPALPVLDAAGRLVGLFTPENVGELVMIHSALGGQREVGPAVRGRIVSYGSP